jgi:hypothetical protein
MTTAVLTIVIGAGICIGAVGMIVFSMRDRGLRRKRSPATWIFTLIFVVSLVALILKISTGRW